MFDFLSNVGTKVAGFLGGDTGRIISSAKSLVNNKSSDRGGASLFTKPVDLGAGTMETKGFDTAKTPDMSAASDYEQFLTEWTEIMQRFARYK